MHNLCIVGSTPHAEASHCTIKRPIGDLSSLSLDVQPLWLRNAMLILWRLCTRRTMSSANAFVETTYGTPMKKHVLRIGETSLELYVLDLRAYLFLLCDDCPYFASFLNANTCNGVADIIFACLRLEVLHRVSFCKIPRVRAMEGEGELEEEGEEEVEEPQRVALRTDTDVVPPTDEENADDEHIARLRRIKRMRMEDTALMASTPGAGSSSDAAPKPRARPRPLHVLPHFVYFCIACNEIVRALGIEEGAIAIRRCRFCYYPLRQTRIV